MDLLLCYASDEEECSQEEEHQSIHNDGKDESHRQLAVSSSAPEQESPTGASPKHDQIPSSTALSSSRKRPRTSTTSTTGTTATSSSLNSTNRSVEIVTKCPSFVRGHPHVRGNWSGLVFVKVGGGKGLDNQVSRSVEAFRQLLISRTNFSGQIYRHDHLHLSLSRPFYLQESSIDSFVALLRERLQFQSSFAVSLSFKNQHCCLINDDNTRSFWVWPIVAATTNELTVLVRHIDEVLQRYHQPTYYDPPLFHVSVASIPEAVTVPQGLVTVKEKEVVDCNLGSAILHVTEIVCTFGTTKEFVIPLLSSSIK